MSSRMEVHAAICGLSQSGIGPSKIASTLKIARSTVQRTLNKKKAGGNCSKIIRPPEKRQN